MTRSMAAENFPVASWLIAAPLRPHVHTFYRFARTADDIADDPAMAPADKLRRLEGMAATLEGLGGHPQAAAMRRSLKQTGTPGVHCRELLAAFRQDVGKRRYRDWADLMAYCRLSAAPVGRYLLDLHEEPRAAWPAADALCAALQVINHLQDCRDDFLALDRVYLPLDAFAAEGAEVEELGQPRASPALRRTLTRVVEDTRPLLAAAAALPAALSSTGLRRETAVILSVAETLLDELALRDPLAERVALGPVAFVVAAMVGLLRRVG